MPLLSASIVGSLYGSPFNGLLLGVGAGVLVAIGARPGALPRSPPWAAALGGAAVALACAYPHFLDGPVWRYLWAAPVGVLPCPTLALVIGLGLLAGGLGCEA